MAQSKARALQVKGVVELTIGYHQLSGKLVPLKKPLAVLEKAFSIDPSDPEEHQESHYRVGGSANDVHVHM